MKRARLIQEAEALFSAGRFTESSDRVVEFLEANDGVAPPQIFNLLAALADTIPQAAVNLAVSYLFGDADEPEAGDAERLLRGVIRGNDKNAMPHAHYFLGGILLGDFGGQTNIPKAIRHLRKAAVAGMGKAAFTLGLFYATGQHDLVVNPAEAAKWYRVASDAGDVRAMTNLGIMIIAGDVPGDLDEAMSLLEDAEEDGDVNAGEMLDMIDAMGGVEAASAAAKNKEQTRGQPQQKVAPPDAKRPRLVVDALVNELGAPRKMAEQATAFLYGYANLKQAIEAAGSNEGGPPDEDCDPKTVKARRTHQEEVLANWSGMDEAEAEFAIDLLRPTCRLGRPSLTRLSEIMENRLFPFSSNETGDAMEAFATMLGIQGNLGELMEEFRTLSPINPEIWLPAMNQHLGWKFRDEDYEAEENGSLVAMAVGTRTHKVPVYMSSVSYIPGDHTDEAVAGLKKRIEAADMLAVLLFNKPLVWIDKKGEQDRGLLYGGLAWKDGKWSDFVLRPGGGVDDAFEQAGHMEPIPSVGFFGKYSFEGAGGLGVTIASMQAGYEPDEVEALMISAPTGWMQPMVSPVE